MKFKGEIAGLRAIAVLVVLFYHAGFDSFSGGFIGVDIFFVLSGYLIIYSILNKLENNTFSFSDFWTRRVRRILPVFFFVVLVTSFLYSFITMPDSFEITGTSILSIGLFVSNIYFMITTGNYFGGGVETKLFLHTWSLSVEEQFYMFIPIGLFLIYKYWKKLIFPTLIFLLSLSFGYSIYLIHFTPSGIYSVFGFLPSIFGLPDHQAVGFYSLGSRAWELLAGGVLAYIHLYKGRKTKIGNNNLLAEISSRMGIGLIMVSIFTYTHQTAFPGYNAVLPVLGTLLIIGSNHVRITYIGSILSSSILQFFGNISYSLYLWHWPILVFLFYFYGLDNVPNYMFVVAFLLSVLLSWLSYTFIENPFRKRKENGEYLISIKATYIAAIFILIIVGVGVTIKINKGLPGRFSGKLLSYVNYSKKDVPDKKCPNIFEEENINCQMLGSTDVKPSFIVIGDSHAKSIYPIVDRLAEEYNVSGLFFGVAGCFMLPGLDGNKLKQGNKLKKLCGPTKEQVWKLIDTNSDFQNVIIAQRRGLYIGLAEDNQKSLISDNNTIFEKEHAVNALEERLLSMDSEMRHKLWIMRQVPFFHESPPEYLFKKSVFNKSEDQSLDAYQQGLSPLYKDHLVRQQSLESIFNKLKTIRILDPAKVLCEDGGYCLYYDKETNDLLYRDRDHLNKYGAYYIEDMFLPMFDEMIEK